MNPTSISRIRPSEYVLPIPYDAERLVSTQCLEEPSKLTALPAAICVLHAGVEAPLPTLRLVSGYYSASEFTGDLRRFCGFYEPFEAAPARFDTASAGTYKLGKTGSLRCDFDNLALTPLHVKTLPRYSELRFVTDANLLGCFYVHGGVALGGQIIARRLRTAG